MPTLHDHLNSCLMVVRSKAGEVKDIANAASLTHEEIKSAIKLTEEIKESLTAYARMNKV